MGFLDLLTRKKDEENKLEKNQTTAANIKFKKLLDFLPKPTPLKPPILPSSHTVQPGDSLWNITKKVNGDPTLWPKLFQENKQIIGKNPDFILPKQNLDLTPILPKLSQGPRLDLLSSLKKSPSPSLPMQAQSGDSTSKFDFSGGSTKPHSWLADSEAWKGPGLIHPKPVEANNNPVIGENLFLTNTFPIKQSDNPLMKGLKGIGNFGISTLSAPGELLRKVSLQGGSLLAGNGLKDLPKNTLFTQDILPKGASNALNNLQKNHPVLGGLTHMAVETAADPVMYLGEGTAKHLLGNKNKSLLSDLQLKNKPINNLQLPLEQAKPITTPNLSGGLLPNRPAQNNLLSRLTAPIDNLKPTIGPSPLKTPLPLGPRKLEPLLSQKLAPQLTGPKIGGPLQGGPLGLKPILPQVKPVGTKGLSFPSTVAKGDITNPKLAEKLSQTEMNYGNITNKDTLEVAKKFIQDDRESALHLVMSDAPATAESNAVAQLLIKQANDTGKFDQAISMIEKTSTKAKTQGQAIQALSMWGRLSPEGVLKFAEKTIEKSKNEHQVFRLNGTTKNLNETMGKVNSQVAESIIKEVESGLGPKLSFKPTRIKAPKLSEDIIKKLDVIESAARERIASRRGNLNSLPVDLLADYAIIGTAKLGKGIVNFSTWSAEMIKEFGDDLKPHLASIWSQSQSGFNDFAKANGINGIEAELTQLNRSVGQGLKDMNVSIGDIVRQHYSVGNKTMDDLVSQLVGKAGLSGEDAAILEKHIVSRMQELTQTKKTQILNQMFKPGLAPNQKEISQKIIELSNLGGFQEQKYKALVGQKLGIPTLDEATAKSIYEQSNKIQTMKDGREKEVAIAQMLDSIAAKIPPTMLQKIGTLQTMAQLLNPKTAIRNIVGNAGFAGIENATNALGAGLDKGLSLLTNQRTRVLPSLTTQLKGGKQGFKLGLEDALKGVSTTSIKTQFDLNATKTFRTGPLGKLETAMNIELRAADRAFYQAAYDESLRGQMQAAKVTKPTEAMKEIADHDGLYKTFQDTNVISSFFSGFKKLLNDPVHFMGKANHREPLAFGVGDFVMKYPKTPGNLLARGLDYSPAGFVKVVMEASKPLMGKEFNQRAFVDALSRSIVGSGGLIGTGALLHRAGIISGKPDSDYDVAALNRQVGLGEYRINVSALKRFVLNGLDPASASLQKGDTLITYDWFQPQALPLAMGADIDKNGAKAQGIVGTVLNGLGTGVNTFADQPVMQGVSSMFGQRNFSDGITKIMQGVPASFVPTLLNQVKQLSDNQKRNTYSPNWLGKTTNLATSKIPLLETRLQPTYDALGKKAETYQNGSNNPLNVFLNPSFVSQYSPSKEAELALNAYKQTGETKQIPTIIPKYFTVTGKRFDLTSEEYANMQRIVGENTRRAFSSISPGSSTTDKQIDLMAKAIEKARVEGKKAVLEGRRIRYVQSGNTIKLK